MKHWIREFNETQPSKFRGDCGCGAYVTGSTHESVYKDIEQHVIEGNASRPLKLIKQRDLTRRVYELEVPASGDLSSLIEAIGFMEDHEERNSLTPRGSMKYTVRDGRDPGDKTIVLSYSANLG